MKRMLLTLLAACGLIVPTLRAQDTLETNVASVNGTGYPTLTAAFGAVANATTKTITLLRDVDYRTENSTTTVAVDVRDVTIDLNQHTVTTGYTESNEPLLVLLGNFTLKNGKVQSNGSYGIFTGNVAGAVDSSLVAKIEKVTVLDGGINVGSKVELIDVTATGDEKYYAVWSDNGGAVTIKSGTYSSKGTAVLGMVQDSKMTIEGGTFTAKANQSMVLGGAYGKPLIKGGTFNKDMSTENATLDESLQWKNNGNGTWTTEEKPKPVEEPMVRDNSAQVYYTLQGTIDTAAKDNEYGCDYYTLLRNVTDSATVTDGRSVELQLSDSSSNKHYSLVAAMSVKNGFLRFTNYDYETKTVSTETWVSPRENEPIVSVEEGGKFALENCGMKGEGTLIKNNGGTVTFGMNSWFDGLVEGAVTAYGSAKFSETAKRSIGTFPNKEWLVTSAPAGQEGNWYVVGTAAIEVGEKKYAYFDLQLAIDQAGENETVKLLSNITASVVVGKDKCITLDLNGKTLQNPSSAKGTPVITNNGTLTIVSTATTVGTIKQYSGSTGELIVNTGTLVVEGGKFTPVSGNGVFANTNGGKTTVKGGSFNQDISTVDGVRMSDGFAAKTTTSDGATTMYYISFAEAVSACPTKGTVTLLKDVSLVDTVTIGKGITLDGNGYALSATNNKLLAFAVTTKAAVCFKNVSLSGVGRAINLLNAASNVTLEGCRFSVEERGVTLSATDEAQVYSGLILTLDDTIINQSKVTEENKGTQVVYNQSCRGISLWNVKNSTVTLKNGSELNGFSYAINVSGSKSDSGVADTEGLKVIVQDSTIRSWAAFNVWGSLGEYTIDRSTLLGINTSSGGSNSFATIAFNDDIYNQFAGSHSENNKLTIRNSTITNYQSGTCEEVLIRIDCGITKLTLEGTNTFTDTTGNVSAVLDLSYMADPIAFLNKNVEYAEGSKIVSTTVGGEALPFAPTYTAYYWWWSGENKEGVYCDLKDIFAGVGYVLTDGEFIDLCADATLDGNVTAMLKDGSAGSFTLTLGEHTITGGTMVLPKGVSVITDGALELFAAENGGALVQLPHSEGMHEIGAFVATIPNGEYVKGYATLQAAVEAAEAIDPVPTITLLRDVVLEGTVTLTKNISIDLAGYTLYAKDGETLAFTANTAVTVTFVKEEGAEAVKGSFIAAAQKTDSTNVTISGLEPLVITKWTDDGAYDLSWTESLTSDTIEVKTPQMLAGICVLAKTQPDDIAPYSIKLMGNIDLSALVWEPIPSFTMTFDGNGYTISGIRVEEVQGNAGLFATLNGTVKNLRVEKATVAVKVKRSGLGASTKVLRYGGVIAGTLGGSIENCAIVGGEVKPADETTATEEGLGGLAGKATTNAQITNCSVSATVTGNNVGSFVGAGNATIANCYVAGALTQATGTLTNVYAKNGDAFVRHNTVDGALSSETLGAGAALNGIGWLLNGQKTEGALTWCVDSNEDCTTLLPFATATVATIPEVKRYLTQDGDNYYANGHEATVTQAIVDGDIATVLQTQRDDYKVNEALTIAAPTTAVVYPGTQNGTVETATLTVAEDIQVCLDTVKSVTLKGTGVATLASASISAEQTVTLDGATLKVKGGITLAVAGTVTVTNGSFIGTDGTSSVDVTGSVTGLSQGLSAWDGSAWVQAQIKAGNGAYYGTVAQALGALNAGDTVTLLSKGVATGNVLATSAGKTVSAGAAYDVADVLGGVFTVTLDKNNTKQLVYAYDLGVGGLTIVKDAKGDLVVEVTVKLAEGGAAPAGTRTLADCTLTVTSTCGEKTQDFKLEGLTFTDGECKVTIPYTGDNFPMGTNRLTVSISKGEATPPAVEGEGTL